MTVPTGAANFADIQLDFGGSNPISLNEYYSGGSLTKTNLGIFAPNGIPASGAISVNDFRGSENTSQVWATSATHSSPGLLGNGYRATTDGSTVIAGSIADNTPDSGSATKTFILTEAYYAIAESKGSPPVFSFVVTMTHPTLQNSVNSNTNSFKTFTDGTSTLQRANASYAISTADSRLVHRWTWASNAPGFSNRTAQSSSMTLTFDCD